MGNSNNTQKYVLTGLMTALVFVLTFLIKVPIPFTSGYIHLGDSMIYISVMVLGPFYGAFASGMGSMLADILGGYVQYALPTLIIKSLMAFIMGVVLSNRKKNSATSSILALIAVWVTFSTGTLLYLNGQIHRIGLDNIVAGITGSDADSEAIQHTTETIKNLPITLTVGVAAVIAILSIAATFLARRNGNTIFNAKAIVGMTAAGMCMVMGYFLIESLMYTPIAASCSIPMNIIQFFGGLLAAGLFAPAVSKAISAVKK